VSLLVVAVQEAAACRGSGAGESLHLVIRQMGRLRGILRREARELLHGGPPTLDLLRPVGPDLSSDSRVLQILDLSMLVGEVLLSSGEPVSETSATMTKLAAACGLPTVDIDITFTSITVCAHRGSAIAPVSSTRLVRYRTTDLTRLAHVTRIVDQVVAGSMSVEGAVLALKEAIAAPHPYPRWVATAGWAGLAASVTSLLGGPPLMGLAAFVVTACIDRLGRVLGRWKVLPFFLQLVGGLVATTATLGLQAVGVLAPGTQPSLVVAANITALLSGLSVVGTVQDAISGFPVTAAGRAVEIAVLSAGLLAGVILGLRLGLLFDLDLDPAGEVGTEAVRFGISAVSAAAAAAMFALASYAPVRSLIGAALAGGIGWSVYAALALYAGFGSVLATGVAATVVGIATGIARRGSGVHSHVIILSGIVPLLPGLTAYRGFYQLATQAVVYGLVSIVLALAIGLALASGVALGDFLARPRTPANGAPSTA
jgi:uncharacterized membrane protein YjjP (DUF1212 family)